MYANGEDDDSKAKFASLANSIGSDSSSAIQAADLADDWNYRSLVHGKLPLMAEGNLSLLGSSGTPLLYSPEVEALLLVDKGTVHFDHFHFETGSP